MVSHKSSFFFYAAGIEPVGSRKKKGKGKKRITRFLSQGSRHISRDTLLGSNYAFLKYLPLHLSLSLIHTPSLSLLSCLAGKQPKYPGLTDLTAHADTTRKRLERKVMSKKALRRVADAMDDISAKRFKDKFGYNFNYALRS